MGASPTKSLHLGYLFQCLKIKDLVNADCKVIILIADLHAVLDNLKSTFETVSFRTEYYIKMMKIILKTLNVNLNNIKFIKGTDFQLLPDYTIDMYKMSSVTNINQCQHAGSEVVKQTKSPLITNLLYVILQSLDMIHLKADAFMGGIDQRKLNTFAMEYLPKIGYNIKKTYLMTQMISGLSTKKSNLDVTLEQNIATKMSASVESSKIDLLAIPNIIKKTISKVYCVDGDADDNSILQLIKSLIFKLTDTFTITSKIYTNYQDILKIMISIKILKILVLHFCGF